jgi:hypothetical protein
LKEWGEVANCVNVKPENSKIKITKGITGEDMINLMGVLVTIMEKKENLKVVIRSDIVRVLLETVMVEEIYPVYVTSGYIQWNVGLAVQKVLFNVDGEDLEILVGEKKLLKTLANTMMRLAKANNLKHAQVILNGIRNLMKRSISVMTSIGRNEDSFLDAIKLLMNSAFNELKNTHEVFLFLCLFVCLFVCLCVCVCVYFYISLCVCACVYFYISLCVCACVCISISLCVYVCISISLCVYVCLFLCLRMRSNY